MTLSIELDAVSESSVGGRFRNDGPNSLVLRHLYPPSDIRVKTDDGELAAYYLDFFSVAVDTFRLAPGATAEFKIDILKEYLFPVSGAYNVWVEYDSSYSSIRTHSTVDHVCAVSNRVRVNVDSQTLVERAPRTKEEFVAQLKRFARSPTPWWKIW